MTEREKVDYLVNYLKENSWADDSTEELLMIMDNPEIGFIDVCNKYTDFIFGTIESDAVNVMDFLIEYGMNCQNRINEEGYSAIMFAAKLNKLDMVKLLTQANAEFNHQTKDGKTVMDLAASKEIKAYISIQAKKRGEDAAAGKVGPDVGDNVRINQEHIDELEGMFMEEVLMNNDPDRCQEFVDDGYDIIAFIDIKTNYLADCITFGCMDVFNWLLDNGVSPDAYLEEQDRTILSFATENNNVDAAKKLIDSGVNTNLLNSDGLTPAMEADKFTNSEIYKYLVTHGADITVKNREGKTIDEVCTNTAILHYTNDNKDSLIETAQKFKNNPIKKNIKLRPSNPLISREEGDEFVKTLGPNTAPEVETSEDLSAVDMTIVNAPVKLKKSSKKEKKQTKIEVLEPDVLPEPAISAKKAERLENALSRDDFGNDDSDDGMLEIVDDSFYEDGGEEMSEEEFQMYREMMLYEMENDASYSNFNNIGKGGNTVKANTAAPVNVEPVNNEHVYIEINASDYLPGPALEPIKNKIEYKLVDKQQQARRTLFRYIGFIEEDRFMLQLETRVDFEEESNKVLFFELPDSMDEITEDEQVEYLKRIVKLGGDINHIENGLTPIQYCVKNNRQDIAIAYIKAGCDINANPINGKDLLSFAMDHSAIDVCEQLVESGIELKRKTKDFALALRIIFYRLKEDLRRNNIGQIQNLRQYVKDCYANLLAINPDQNKAFAEYDRIIKDVENRYSIDDFKYLQRLFFEKPANPITPVDIKSTDSKKEEPSKIVVEEVKEVKKVEGVRMKDNKIQTESLKSDESKKNVSDIDKLKSNQMKLNKKVKDMEDKLDTIINILKDK